uniref:Uncharacterized protein n=1 Tax=Anopheles minimus TaxID=112268 RepID=A0A182W4G9_9DIPT
MSAADAPTLVCDGVGTVDYSVAAITLSTCTDTRGGAGTFGRNRAFLLSLTEFVSARAGTLSIRSLVHLLDLFNAKLANREEKPVPIVIPASIDTGAYDDVVNRRTLDSKTKCAVHLVLLDTTKEATLEWTRYPYGPQAQTPGIVLLLLLLLLNH